MTTKVNMPTIDLWFDKGHEMSLGWNILKCYNNKDDEARDVKIVKAAINLILALAARDNHHMNPYQGFVHAQNYFDPYPINLHSFKRCCEKTWQQLSLADLLGWIASEWGLNVHMRVALRKLRYRSEDTSRIRYTENGLRVVDFAEPVFSNPRLWQSIQILFDLGLLDEDQHTNKNFLTAKGMEVLGDCNA